MRFLKRFFASDEIKAVYAALDEASYRYREKQFQPIRDIIDQWLEKSADEIGQVIQKSGRSPREWVYSQIGNVAGDLLESGKFNVYRGVINPLGPGKDVLRIFDDSYDVLLEMKAVDAEYTENQKSMLRQNIKNIG